MRFDEPEVIELGAANELVQDLDDLENSESSMPSRIKLASAIYISDAE